MVLLSQSCQQIAVVEVSTSPDFFWNQRFAFVSPRITNLIDECWCLQVPPACFQWQNPRECAKKEQVTRMCWGFFFLPKKMMYLSWIFEVF